jgi:hypothetical protein
MNLDWLWNLLEKLWAGLWFLTPAIAAAAMIFAQRAAFYAARNNAAIESMWILLKAVRQRQEGQPPAAKEPGKPSE